jgi:hypothetical protein
VPKELWWDNPKTVATTILRGRKRELNQRWQALPSHYNFEPLFCLPARGNEKPHAENRVRLLERQWGDARSSSKRSGCAEQRAIESCSTLAAHHHVTWTAASSVADPTGPRVIEWLSVSPLPSQETGIVVLV